jgi:uncharacterized SAM-binding protein YcdF (DUF218 family)
MTWLRLALLLIVLCGVTLYGVGFIAFSHHVAESRPPQATDARMAVVLTGGSSGRLAAAMDLLDADRIERLLVSGVDPRVTNAQVRVIMDGRPEKFDCCVEFGREARDTMGNAEETAAFARRHGIDALIVVTDDYHMPRALKELKSRMPSVQLVPWPVKTGLARDGAWRDRPGVAIGLAAEYSKYLLVAGREFIIGLGQPEPGDEARRATS